ncbi:hypothetical protein BDW22DRAFT_179537 [Trametopsis cervina]|nr:hypothetical protein BDW22DRAFT_179537 [Trametopsis cervina]
MAAEPQQTGNNAVEGTGYTPRLSPAYVVPRLPPELCDMIIENLCGDKLSLSACSIVSRSWLRTARQHLFESVLVSRQNQPDAFQSFVAFLKARPELCNVIRIICVDGYTEDTLLHGDLQVHFMSSIVEQIPGLKALLLLNCGWLPTKAANMGLYQRPPVPIEDVYINSFRAHRGPPSSKLEVLRQFSHIDNLYLTRLWLGHFDVDRDDDPSDGDSDDEGQVPVRAAPHPPLKVKVKALTLSMADVCLNFLEHLRRQPFITSLTSLTIRELWQASYLENHEDMFLIGDIIRDKIGSSLSNFEIDLPRHGPRKCTNYEQSFLLNNRVISSGDTPHIFTGLLLNSCTSLKTVTVNMLLQNDEGPRADGEHALLTVNEESLWTDSEGDGEGASESEDESRYEDVHDEDDDDDTNPTELQAQYTMNPHATHEDDFVHNGHTSSPPRPAPPTLYTKDEWRVPTVLLSQLPQTLTDISIAVDFTGFADEYSDHLATVPNWAELERQCLQFSNLKSVRIKRIERSGGEAPLHRSWEQADQKTIAHKLPRLHEKNLLMFDI